MRLNWWKSLLTVIVVLLISYSIFGVDMRKQLSTLRLSYNKWLEEDVAYIITHEETEQYKQLKTNEQRDLFITEFWLRRDPTPGTVENEFKEEHYRRLAYSNNTSPTMFPAGRPIADESTSCSDHPTKSVVHMVQD